MQELIRKLNRENLLWGAERIRDTLLLLEYDPPGEDTIRRYMVKPDQPHGCPSCGIIWRGSWAIDFFTVTTLNFATLYVFVVFDHGRRQVIHWRRLRGA